MEQFSKFEIYTVIAVIKVFLMLIGYLIKDSVKKTETKIETIHKEGMSEIKGLRVDIQDLARSNVIHNEKIANSDKRLDSVETKVEKYNSVIHKRIDGIDSKMENVVIRSRENSKRIEFLEFIIKKE